MFRFALEKSTVLNVAVLIVCLFGITAVLRVPVQMIPDLSPRIISVDTRWPGATPQDIEKEILVEQEEYLRALAGLDRMVSSANFGSAEIELEFPYGTEINDALIRVNNALSQVPGYPENVDEPRVTTNSFSENAFMYYGVKLLPGNPGELVLEDQMDWVEDNIRTRLERVPGVASVRVFGGARRQVNIYLDPAKLATRNITLMQVRNAIRARNRDASAGDVDFGKRRYLMRTLGRFETVDDINNLVLTERDGAFIRLADVGEARMSRDEIRSYNYGNGEPMISFSIRKQIGSNVIRVMDDVVAAVEELNAGIAADHGLYIQLNSEDVRYVRNSVRTVMTNLAIGAALATLVLLLFLRSVSATLIGAVGIPVCTLAAFLGLSLGGRTINVISLAGVAFAIGMTLDNSIVALENIARHVGLGKDRFNAALDGIREVWPAIFASTMTTVLVFLPVMLLELEAGQLYSDIAVAISASILMSMFVAITIIPAACSRLLRLAPQGTEGERNVRGGALRRIAAAGAGVGRGILGTMSWLLDSTTRRISALLVTVAVALGILFNLVPPAEYLPEGEEAKVFALMLAPPGYNLETMHDILKEIDPDFSSQVGADGSAYAAGETDVPPLMQHFARVGPGMLRFVTEPVGPEYTQALTDVLTERFRAVPGMRSFASRGSIFSGNRGGTRSINVELSGRDLDTLFGTALDLYLRADSLFDGAQINASPSPPTLSMSQPIARVRPDWERAAEFGMTQSDLGYTVRAYSDGAFVDEFFLDDDKLDMYLYSTSGTLGEPKDLENIMLLTGTGQMVPLSALARVEETVGNASVRRVNGLRTVTLSVVPPRDVALETGVEIVRRDLIEKSRADGALPPGIAASITGASSDLEQTRRVLRGNFLLAVVIAYLLLVAVFSHWGYPLLIMTTVPIGIGGGVVGLWVLNFFGGHLDVFGLAEVRQPFDVITMLGFLILIGTVVNNPILIVERAVANLKERGMAVRDAVVEATRVRLRPVMMSTITTVCGLSPLVLIPGAGSELYRGLGAIVLFGLLLSSVVTLTVLPVLIAIALETAQRFNRTPVATAGSPGLQARHDERE